MHSLRHVAASPWIDLGYNPKRVQALMEHSTIAMTLDTYTHLGKGKGCVDATKTRHREQIGAQKLAETLGFQEDFDSAMRRFESSRPSQLADFGESVRGRFRGIIGAF